MFQRFKPKDTPHRQYTAVYVSVPKKVVIFLMSGIESFIFVPNIFMFLDIKAHLNKCIRLYVSGAQLFLFQNEDFILHANILWFHISCMKSNDLDTLGEISHI